MLARIAQLSWRDWGVPAVFFVITQLELWVAGPQSGLIHGPTIVFAVVYTIAPLALCFRRTRPTTVLVTLIVILLATGTPWLYVELTSAMYMLVVAIFACGRYGTTWARFLALVLPALPVLAVIWVSPDTLADSWAWSLNAWWIFALGAGFRHERNLRDQLAEATAAEAEVRAANERLRVARDVHDVVSHGLSVVVVQAELAQLFVESDPARARAAMKNVEDTGREALADVRGVLESLREADRADPDAQSPSFTDVPDLVDRMQRSGLPVLMDAPPESPSLSTQVSATAYRVVQEALTNVLRHAGQSPTSLRIDHDDRQLVIDVRDAGGESLSAAGEGFGLSGMRERVVACGGQLTVGTSAEGGFRVRAVLPVSEA
jgi:signal transduction histidine kinase